MSAIDRLTEEFGRLPGVGSKTALRLVHHLMKGSKDDTRRLARALIDVADKVRSCEVCGSFSEHELCAICSNPRRDRTVVILLDAVRPAPAVTMPIVTEPPLWGTCTNPVADGPRQRMISTMQSQGTERIPVFVESYARNSLSPIVWQPNVSSRAVECSWSARGNIYPKITEIHYEIGGGGGNRTGAVAS